MSKVGFQLFLPSILIGEINNSMNLSFFFEACGLLISSS